jgi:hypothetical protein
LRVEGLGLEAVEWQGRHSCTDRTRAPEEEEEDQEGEGEEEGEEEEGRETFKQKGMRLKSQSGPPRPIHLEQSLDPLSAVQPAYYPTRRRCLPPLLPLIILPPPFTPKPITRAHVAVARQAGLDAQDHVPSRRPQEPLHRSDDGRLREQDEEALEQSCQRLVPPFL